MAVNVQDPTGRGRATVFMRLVGSYWMGEARFTAWLLGVMLLGLILASVVLQALINTWNARFFDALEKRAQGDI